MKNLLTGIVAVAALTISTTSCKKTEICDDVTCPSGYICDNGNCIVDPNAPIQSNNIVKSGQISANETWSASNIYELAGKVVVPTGVTLTIEAGTIIKGRPGQGSLSSALIIARGGKIMANGTASKPIIFTSTLDNIKLGQKSGTNLSETDHSKWGGLIILGKAKISAKVGDTEAQIEGIPADETYGKYGGTDDTDNSGTIKYVSIRHGGTLIGEGNEINGLTLGGVGNGTTIDYIEVVANLDDGIECFGGTVNINHALVAYQGDDGFDIDQNYAGTFENSMVVYDNTGDEMLEIDGPENSTYTAGKFTIKNCTFISKTSDGTVDLKSKAQGIVKDCKFTGFTKFKLSASFNTSGCTAKTDAYDKYISTDLKVEGNNTTSPLTVYTKSTCSIPGTYQTAVDAIFNAAGNGSSATGANVSDFAWTWTSIKGKL